MHKPESVLNDDLHKILWTFEKQTDHLIPARKPDLLIINQKTRTCHQGYFVFPADDRVKIKENEKRDKCLYIATALKNMILIEIPIATGAVGTVNKSLEREVEELEVRGRVETI